ncbi:MAG: STAS domain-containing protein [Gemmatimonadales bacterium]|jgi:anti-anti-sigma factor
MAASPREALLPAPRSLDLETAAGFRREAQSLLDGLAPGGGQLVVDLSGTTHIDSAGLGTLVMIWRYAGERRHRVRLDGLDPEVRAILEHTRVLGLFEVAAGDEA